MVLKRKKDKDRNKGKNMRAGLHYITSTLLLLPYLAHAVIQMACDADAWFQGFTDSAGISYTTLEMHRSSYYIALGGYSKLDSKAIITISSYDS